jgi:hypothetical protein
MKFREHLASAIGVLGLAVDAGIALMSMVVAVPFAFVVGEVGKDRADVGGQSPPPSVPSESTTDDLGTVVTYR